MQIINGCGHPGGQVSMAGANMVEGIARMEAIGTEDCAEIAIPTNPYPVSENLAPPGAPRRPAATESKDRLVAE